ncbi:MAG TPA: ABC transporter ATP-binding protein [Micromonosporaceae bacterium]
MTMAVTGLAASLDVQRGQFGLRVALSAEPGEVVALLGPNGAGKTTALRTLAGLAPLDRGRIVVDGEVWDDPATATFVPARRRRVGMVFQDYLLFPHLSAVDNVAFGPRCHGMDRARARQQAQAWLDRMGLTAVAAAKPARLSGGQAQRVALARALAVSPRLLLLDEPLAALDAATRQEIRADLRHHLAGAGQAATLLVTHDPLDAMVLADRIVVVEAGQVVQQGSAAEITRFPRTEYVARLVGLNLYRGTGAGHLVTVDSVAVAAAESVDGPAFVAFAPSAVALHRQPPEGSPRNTWSAVVAGLERHGDMVRVRLDGPLPAAADITSAAAADLGLAPGTPVWAAVKATETHAYPAS